MVTRELRDEPEVAEVETVTEEAVDDGVAADVVAEDDDDDEIDADDEDGVAVMVVVVAPLLPVFCCCWSMLKLAMFWIHSWFWLLLFLGDVDELLLLLLAASPPLDEPELLFSIIWAWAFS